MNFFSLAVVLGILLRVDGERERKQLYGEVRYRKRTKTMEMEEGAKRGWVLGCAKLFIRGGGALPGDDKWGPHGSVRWDGRYVAMLLVLRRWKSSGPRLWHLHGMVRQLLSRSFMAVINSRE